MQLEHGMKIADLGSGSGFYSLEAARVVGDGGKVYAIDVQKDLLAKLKNAANASHLPNVEVIPGDLEKVGGARLADGSVDVAIAANILFQIAEKEAFLREAKRIIKTGGKLAVVDWSDSFGGIGPMADHVIKEDEARELAVKEGFTFERDFKAGAHHYGLIFKK